MVLKLFVIGIGGFVGAVSRYGVTGWVHQMYTGTFPLGTLTVNALGSFFLGFLMAWTEQSMILSPQTRLFLQIGFLGSFTTFSTVSYETWMLWKEKSFLICSLNLFGNLSLGLVSVSLGWILGKWILQGG